MILRVWVCLKARDEEEEEWEEGYTWAHPHRQVKIIVFQTAGLLFTNQQAQTEKLHLTGNSRIIKTRWTTCMSSTSWDLLVEVRSNKVQILCYCTSVDVSGICTYLEDLSLRTAEHRSKPAPPHSFITGLLLQFECILRGIMDYFYLASTHVAIPTSQDWFHQCMSHTADAARLSKNVRSRKQTERKTGLGRNGVLVSRICREFLIFSLCCCSGRFTNPTCVCLTSDNETQHQTQISCLCGAFRNS